MRVLVTGASGLLGSYLLAARPSHATVLGWSGRPCPPSSELPLTPVPLENPRSREAAYRMTRPDVVLHLAARATLGDCVKDPTTARRINTDATAHLAQLARDSNARLIFVSTDLVFDGTTPPYAEDAPTHPLSVYGRTKADAELAVLATSGTVVRFPLLFGPGRNGRASFFDHMVASLRKGEPLTLFHDEYRTPLDLPTAAHILWRLADIPTSGIYHAGGHERISRVDMGLRLAAHLGLYSAPIHAVSRLSLHASEPRPADTSLHSGRLLTLLPDLIRPTYEQALAHLVPSAPLA